ncbi:hypothetical protein Pmani_034725 [Petrolisthes manimaculis]|uniref:Transmembrane protein 45B n=1 Tax=Petrolisthes manimaculis TaxID=1843537 RepID=A0AAE1NM01_9EUCA|nr:hypothetical protein Pmani_034725 [Petrolisthes manimaculis]
MGNLGGHVIPGSFLVLFSVWWTFSIFKRYYLCKRATLAEGEGGENGLGVGSGGGGRLESGKSSAGVIYVNTATFPCLCFSHMQLEGVLKITFTIIGIVGEFVTGFKGGKFVNLENAQHIVMYFFFCLNGVMDVLSHYGAPQPPHMDYVTACLAFAIEAVIFSHHLHGLTSMDIQMHKMLLYLAWGCVVALMAEVYFRRSIVPALIRIYLVLLQGTWFFQIGFILYPPWGMEEWDQEDHSQMMVVTITFCWHAALVFLFMLLVNWIMYCKTRRLSPTSVYHRLRPMQSSSQQSIQHLSKMDTDQMRRIIEDSEEEDL